MLIEFDKMEPTIIPRMRGGEKEVAARMYTDPLNKIMRGRLIPGATIGMHTHETGSEIIYILKGKADFLYNEGTEQADAGGCHYCPKGHSHSMMNNGDEDLIFFAVVPEQ